MKTGMLFITMILVLGFNAAAETPYARTCRISGGQPWAVSMDSEFDTSLCRFGQAAVGAAEFAQYKWGQGLGQSLKVFLNQRSFMNPHRVCDVVGAATRTATDTEGVVWGLCKFVDGSVVEANTLAAGVNSPANADLVNALN